MCLCMLVCVHVYVCVIHSRPTIIILVSYILLQAAELVYMYLNSTGQHETLLGSPHFTSYVNFLISRRLIDSLLTKTLQAKR